MIIFLIVGICLFFLPRHCLPRFAILDAETKGSAPCPPGSLRSFPDIGGGGKRKPPPMHRMRRLREPGKIHRRRRACFWDSSVLFLRLSGEVSQASIRRFPCPQGGSHEGRVTLPWSRHARPSLRGKSVCLGDPGQAPFRVGGNSISKIRSADGTI